MNLPELQASDTPHEKVLSKSLLGWDTSVHLIYKCCIENMQAEHIAKKELRSFCVGDYWESAVGAG